MEDLRGSLDAGYYFFFYALLLILVSAALLCFLKLESTPLIKVYIEKLTERKIRKQSLGGEWKAFESKMYLYIFFPVFLISPQG